MDVVVARIGRAHGLRGEVTIEVRTDAPQERFVPGAQFTTDPATAGPLQLETVRDHNGTLLLGFVSARDRSAAEGLRGVLLLADTDEAGDDEDAWYEKDLVGLSVVTVSGEPVGEVVALEPRPTQDLLVVRLTDGREALVPFVVAIVPEVDVAGGRVVIDPPAGLFDLEAP
jgi:16S rRNA processing protein RimM